MIYDFVLDHGDLWLDVRSDGLVCAPRNNHKMARPHLNPMQHVCQQLRVETRGRETTRNHVSASQKTFETHMPSGEASLSRHMRFVTVFGFYAVARQFDGTGLSPFVDFCWANTQIKRVRLVVTS